MQGYFDPKRASDPHALPDLEVFYADAGDLSSDMPEGPQDDEPSEAGWYWWPCLPGCLPDGPPEGPFASADEALRDAQGGNHEDDED